MVLEMKPVIVEVLSEIEELEDFGTEYPSGWDIPLPIAIYRTVQRPHFIDTHRQELQTHWTIVVEIYTDQGSLTPIRNYIVDKFNEFGFSGKGHDSNIASLNRVVCEFKGIVDNNMRLVFNG